MDHQQPLNTEDVYRLEADVAQLRQELVTERDLHAAGILAFGEMCEKREALEAARDHLRARLQQLVLDWREDVRWTSAYNNGRLKCAADLLAVLTEPEEKK